MVMTLLGSRRHTGICYACLFLTMAAVLTVTSAIADSVEERFQTELGETMQCIHTSGHPAITAVILQSWLKLRDPFRNYGFPGLQDHAGPITSPKFLKRASENLAAQRHIIQKLQSRQSLKSVILRVSLNSLPLPKPEFLLYLL